MKTHGIDKIYNFAEDNFFRKRAEGPQNQRLPRLFWVLESLLFSSSIIFSCLMLHAILLINPSHALYAYSFQ